MIKIQINNNENLKKVFVFENGELVEQYEENFETRRLEGNIYLGKVKNVIKGMQSAFVDIGTEKNALINIRDIMPKESSITGNDKVDLNKHSITDYIKPGDNAIVQIKRDSSKLKGARITKDIKLTGEYSVLMPFSNFITVSKKIENKDEKKRLTNIANQILKNNNIKYGIIIRTSAITQKEEVIEEDIKRLSEIWNNIKSKAKKSSAPTELYSMNGIVGKLITDFEPKGLEIYTNSEFEKKHINKINPNIKVKIKKDIFYETEEKKKVWLKCGGFITIDKTEALIAIDVNSGKCLGKKELEETVFKVNKEAAQEIARQLRLRDLGGIIIIDFIDMSKETDRENIIKIMNDALKKDRSKVQIVEFTKLGLLEMTRKNIFRK